MKSHAVWLYSLALCSLSVACRAGEPTATPVLPEIIVSPFREERLIGPYQQPEWTTRRRFPTTRVYLQQPPGTVAFEQWWRGRFYRGGKEKHRFQEEVEIGLPHRLQLDIYENWTMNENGYTRHDSVAVELRWALADWGRIPLNPTLYGEWKFVDEGSDVYELKLLLGEEFGYGWHWGLNAIYEQEIEDAKTTEWAVSQAISRTLRDEKLSLGVEMKASFETKKGSRDDPEEVYLLGPSLQWRPSPRTHLDLVGLFGLNDDAPRVESYVVFGVDLGGPGAKKAREPISLKSE